MHTHEADRHPTTHSADPQEAPAEQHDLALIERVLAGDESALEELVRMHYDRVWRGVWRIVRHDQHAEGVVQEVFLAAFAALPGFRGEPRFRTWLRQITMDRAMRFVHSRRGRRLEQAEQAGGRPLELGHAPLLLQACFETLDGSLRAPISLQLEGLSYEEIARALDLPVGMIRSRLFLAREALNRCVRRKRVAHDA